jgi:hypothetical protein
VSLTGNTSAQREITKQCVMYTKRLCLPKDEYLLARSVFVIFVFLREIIKNKIKDNDNNK